jgi:ferrous iron transport protein A
MEIDGCQSLFSKLENIKVQKQIYLSPMLKKLSDVQTGKYVRINSFIKNDIFLKLMEMGCLPGEIISIEKIAPLGDPISIKVAGYFLSLRLNEAETILVEEL